MNMTCPSLILSLGLLAGLAATNPARAEQPETTPPPQQQAPAAVPPATQPSDKATDPQWELRSLDYQFSYAIGVDLGNRYGWMPQTVRVDPQVVAQGVADAIARKVPLTSQQLITVADLVDTRVRELRQKQAAEFIQRNKDFLAENRGKQGVKITDTGLQYQVLREGSGRQPQSTSFVSVHYKGKLIDGTEFDDSYKRGEPGVFSVLGVIEGWKQALPMMKEGAQWRLVVPPELGYGEIGDGAQIPANAVLIFDIELISVQ
ncbi:MAG: FKBP-type peptidyl-prolyl cis-trans isomerase [Phycisphaeraceae bacterium]|nr:FKBP-type peptidyl-prolyl cis-trans isomerase [Phycisphaeraceae bacterium]